MLPPRAFYHRAPSQTSVQVTTSWAMHNGLVVLHTVKSLGGESNESPSTSQPRSSLTTPTVEARTGYRHRSSSSATDTKPSSRAGLIDTTDQSSVAGANRVDLGTTSISSNVREAFVLLHPLVARPSFYSPNKKLEFSLHDSHRQAIEALDDGDEEGIVPPAKRMKECNV